MSDPQESWENELVDETEQKLSSFNVGASDFVPNANAFTFVPGAGLQASEPEPVLPQPTKPTIPQPAPAADIPKEEIALPVKKDRKQRANSESASDDEGMSDEARANLAALYEDAGKQHLNIIFIGHVDAGKSTMGGQIL